jgi:oligopeptide/dipeptide ABC transporter ATP-binding protein
MCQDQVERLEYDRMMPTMMNTKTLLSVRGLKTIFTTRQGVVRAVDGVDLELGRGEILGLVGESGSGKTVTALSILGLIDPPGEIAGGEVWFDGRRIDQLEESEWEKLRGESISMIFQEPHARLNPVFNVGNQVAEVLQVHRGLGVRRSLERSASLLEQVGLRAEPSLMRAYPHELSGGQVQRVMIAMGLALNPQLIIADEPTTALDVTIQAQILDLLRSLRNEGDTSLIFITHDLAVLAQLADRVAVLYGGQIVEQAPTLTLLTHPLHPYTQGLLTSIPRYGQRDQRLVSIPGNVPSPLNPPRGCRFAPRCEAKELYELEICEHQLPPLKTSALRRAVRCWLYQPVSGHVPPLREDPSDP